MHRGGLAMLNRPEVLYEDNHLLVLDKPSLWIVQGASPEDRSILEWGKDYLKKKYAKPGNVFLAAVSRLDRGVSGVVPLARTSKAAARLNEQIRSRQVRKVYTAMVSPPPAEPRGTLRHYLVRDEKRAKSIAFDSPRPEAVEAVLNYEVIERKQKFAVLRIELITGRKHQIRAQLAAAGSPIVYDTKYGGVTARDYLTASVIKATRAAPVFILLHCSRFELTHPTNGESQAFVSQPWWLLTPGLDWDHKNI